MFKLNPILAGLLRALQPLYFQHDMSIANDTGSAVRADINNALNAIATLQSGAAAPSTTYAYQLWADTTNSVLKQRNAANTSWLVRQNLAESFVLSRSSNTILGVADFGKTIVATSTFSQTFTAAATLADGWFVVYRNDGTGVITFDPNASEQIDGATTLKLLPGESCLIWCNGTAFKTIGRDIQKNDVQLLQNVGLSVSVAGNALTVALKDEQGNDPAPGSPVRIGFRSATLTTGNPDVLEVTAAASVTASSGSTLGTVSNQAHRIYVLGINDAGTFRLGLWNPWDDTNKVLKGINEQDLYSSTAEGGAGAADSAQVIYTGTAVTSKAVRVLGYFESTQTTAGTWAAEDSKVQVMGPGVRRTGDILQTIFKEYAAVATGTTTIPLDDTIPQNTEGNEFINDSITPRCALTVIECEMQLMLTATAGSEFIAAMFQDSAADAIAVTTQGGPQTAGRSRQLNLSRSILNTGTAAIALKARAGMDGAATIAFNGNSAGTRRFGTAEKSYNKMREIFV